ncbi:hypothetical protein [Granulicella arctica]|uniref:Uncharacterized protein n=1 Tax=Granulicella arctica TaxID=940613 RepID=A0A7Y9TGE3_9BACT|nr:hypothetical protein [Granulicella arctica]NYF78670.1 hypothetical protein [Granulicella arctica]
MDRVTPKIRFGIAPGTSARISEQEHEAAGPSPSMRIQGGTAARKAEAEARVETRRPYGVSMQARTGKACSLEELMEAEAAARRGPGQHPAQRSASMAASSISDSSSAGERAQDRVQTTAFRPVPVHNQFSATAGETLSFAASPAGTSEETPTAPRSPFQILRSLFSRTPGTERQDGK